MTSVAIRVAPRPAARRKQRTDAAPELPDRERLGDVVVGAELETEHLVELLAARGEHDDRHVALAAQPLAHLQPVEPREHDVEDDEVHVFLARTGEVPPRRPAPARLGSRPARAETSAASGSSPRRRRGGWSRRSGIGAIARARGCRPAYYSPAMEAARPRGRRRRPRRGTVRRPVNTRLVRVACVVIAPASSRFCSRSSTTGVLPRSAARPALRRRRRRRPARRGSRPSTRSAFPARWRPRSATRWYTRDDLRARPRHRGGRLDRGPRRPRAGRASQRRHGRPGPVRGGRRSRCPSRQRWRRRAAVGDNASGTGRPDRARARLRAAGVGPDRAPGTHPRPRVDGRGRLRRRRRAAVCAAVAVRGRPRSRSSSWTASARRVDRGSRIAGDRPCLAGAHARHARPPRALEEQTGRPPDAVLGPRAARRPRDPVRGRGAGPVPRRQGVAAIAHHRRGRGPAVRPDDPAAARGGGSARRARPRDRGPRRLASTQASEPRFELRTASSSTSGRRAAGRYASRSSSRSCRSRSASSTSSCGAGGGGFRFAPGISRAAGARLLLLALRGAAALGRGADGRVPDRGRRSRSRRTRLPVSDWPVAGLAVARQRAGARLADAPAPPRLRVRARLPRSSSRATSVALAWIGARRGRARAREAVCARLRPSVALRLALAPRRTDRVMARGAPLRPGLLGPVVGLVGARDASSTSASSMRRSTSPRSRRSGTSRSARCSSRSPGSPAQPSSACSRSAATLRTRPGPWPPPPGVLRTSSLARLARYTSAR